MLLIQRCRDCGTYRHIPRPMCPECHSLNSEWSQVSGRGKVYSFTVSYRAAHPAFKEDVPYIIAIVKLEEGVGLTTNIIDCSPEEIYVGMPVEVVFDDVTGEITLPKFKKAK